MSRTARAPGCDPLELLVRTGILEQAVADALHPVHDGPTTVEATLGAATLAAAHALLAANPARRHQCRIDVAEHLDHLGSMLPGCALAARPEGFSDHALDPLAFAASARRWQGEVGGRAARSIVIGIRSIGTSLGAIVRAATRSADGITIRPRGEPGSRRILVESPVTDRILAAVARGGCVLVVDEGPGATGETFDVIACWLRAIGVPARGLVLFGSGRSRTPMAPPDRRARLDALALRLPPLRDRRLHDLRRRHGLIHVADISGGRWREPLHGRDVPAAPGFERSKSLALRDDGALMQIRYVGVGPWGDDVLARALALEHAGLAPPAEPVRGGFALLPWRRGRPLRRGRKPDARIFAALVSWAARRAPLFDTGIVVDTDRFEAMLEHNAREAGVPAPAIAGAIRLLAAQPPREAVVPDAKLQPWEWLAGPAGLLKVDALEHGDDSRLPGPADAAWDVAGIAIEFGLEPGELAALIDRTARARHEPIDEVTAAVRAWRAVYAAAGFGAAAFDLHTAGADDRPGLQAEVEFYTRALATECLRAAQAARHAAVTVSACVRRARTPSRPGRGS